MAFSAFDRRLLEEGLEFFGRPRLATLLELLGDGMHERVGALSRMLRHSAPEEYDEAVEIFERATARAERPRRASVAEPGRRERYAPRPSAGSSAAAPPDGSVDLLGTGLPENTETPERELPRRGLSPGAPTTTTAMSSRGKPSWKATTFASMATAVSAAWPATWW